MGDVSRSKGEPGAVGDKYAIVSTVVGVQQDDRSRADVLGHQE